MFDEMRELYQSLIMDHNKSPHNFGPLKKADVQVEGNNPLCGDQFTVYVKFDGDTVSEVHFDGVGCAISKASASLMTDAVKGKSREEAAALFSAFHKMVTEGAEPTEELGKLKVFQGVGEFPARVKCATLAWRTMEACLQGDAAGEPVTTE